MLVLSVPRILGGKATLLSLLLSLERLGGNVLLGVDIGALELIGAGDVIIGAARMVTVWLLLQVGPCPESL